MAAVMAVGGIWQSDDTRHCGCKIGKRGSDQEERDRERVRGLVDVCFGIRHISSPMLDPDTHKRSHTIDVCIIRLVNITSIGIQIRVFHTFSLLFEKENKAFRTSFPTDLFHFIQCLNDDTHKHDLTEIKRKFSLPSSYVCFYILSPHGAFAFALRKRIRMPTSSPLYNIVR